FYVACSVPAGKSSFPLGNGKDPDIGVNSLQNYQLTPNPLFSLVVRESPDGTKHAELVLEKSLDREKQRNHHLVLTAVDGGDPVRSGTAQIKINVTDANDNPPVFTKEIYKVRLLENLPEGTIAFQVKATDRDEGVNAEITYSFSDITNSARQLFTLNSRTGDVKITGPLDYEEGKYYEASVEGKDGGGLSAHAKVQIDILDVNDNAPALSLLPILNPIPEDSIPSTGVAVINVRDRDSGDNGEVSCNIDAVLNLPPYSPGFSPIGVGRESWPVCLPDETIDQGNFLRFRAGRLSDQEWVFRVLCAVISYFYLPSWVVAPFFLGFPHLSFIHR
uniref:Cadherin domain-containing protein n=1 Tax=Calidris pygmaea TaxID=425635 RepID=A0A8C3KN58_9CHAR